MDIVHHGLRRLGWGQRNDVGRGERVRDTSEVTKKDKTA